MNKAWFVFYLFLVVLVIVVAYVSPPPCLYGTYCSGLTANDFGWVLVSALLGAGFFVVIIRVIYVGLRNLFR
jgi:hypothetical protein